MSIRTLAELVRVHAAERGDRPMVTFEGRTRSFADMDIRSNQVAQALAAEGVGVGDRIAFLDHNVPEYFECVFAAAKLGAVTVALNWRLSAREIAGIIDDAGARVLVAGPEFSTLVEKIENTLTSVRRIVVLGDHALWPSYEAWLGIHDAVDPGYEAEPSDVAFQLYTSGTTGLPKGVMLTHDNVFALLPGAEQAWGFTPDAVSLGVMPLFHIAGSGWNIAAMFFGAHTVLLRDVDPVAIITAIADYGITHTVFVPAVLQMLLATPGVDDADFSSLQLILYGASPITDSVLTRAMSTFRCDFVQAYGLTETTGAVIQLAAADHDPSNRPDLLRSCGRPMPGVELRVVDHDGRDTPDGEVGEVWIRSPQNMLGYWRRPEETAAALTADGWLRTGDAGYLVDGYLYLYDRVKDMVVTGGENVYPAEVENVLAGHPAVADVAVIGVPDVRWGETVKALVVRADLEVAAPDLIAFAREHLAHYKCPTSVDFVDALARNASGKLLKREIREPYWAGHDRRVGG